MGIRLVLVRHAKSDYPPGVVDHDRPLNPRGLRDAPMIGHWIADHVPVESADQALVLVSSAVRTQQTWAAMQAALPQPWMHVRAMTEGAIYEAPSQLLRRVLDEADGIDEGSTVVMVGHNPGTHDLIIELGAASALHSQAAERFPTSAVAVLVTELPWSEAVAGRGTFEVTSFGIPRG
jgi:phosphohistidine phosphatase